MGGEFSSLTARDKIAKPASQHDFRSVLYTVLSQGLSQGLGLGSLSVVDSPFFDQKVGGKTRHHVVGQHVGVHTSVVLSDMIGTEADIYIVFST